MAKKLSVQVIGAPLKRDVEASTVAEVMTKLSLSGDLSVIINQVPASKEASLSDGDFIVFTQNIKGAMSWDDLDEEIEGQVEYVFQSPSLVILRLGTCGYRVNGLRVSKEQLNELFIHLGSEMLSK